MGLFMDYHWTVYEWRRSASSRCSNTPGRFSMLSSVQMEWHFTGSEMQPVSSVTWRRVEESLTVHQRAVHLSCSIRHTTRPFTSVSGTNTTAMLLTPLVFIIPRRSFYPAQHFGDCQSAQLVRDLLVGRAFGCPRPPSGLEALEHLYEPPVVCMMV